MVLQAIVALLAVLVDRAIGDPRTRFHPVALLGRFIAWWGRPVMYPSELQRFAGGAMWLLTASLFAIPFVLAERLLPLAAYVLIAPFLLKCTFAWRSLEEHAQTVREALDRSLEEARELVGRMVSRSTTQLDREQILSAAYESVAENIVDSITAPLFYYLLGELLGGWGLGMAAFYRAANTMDAMLGYRDERERLGWASARMDDLLNFVPARITGALMLAYFTLAGRGREAWAILLRDRRKRPGMNGGIPMALVAGGTGIAFEKPGAYRIGVAERRLEEAGGDLMRHTRAIVLVFISILLAALFLSAPPPHT